MTYCCGILVADGLVMIADTRTNAGLDDISTYRKLHLFQSQGRHAIAIATAGNLSATQNVINLLTEGVNVLVVVPHNGKSAATIVASAHKAGVPVIAYLCTVRV